jgi:hypothetical protein
MNWAPVHLPQRELLETSSIRSRPRSLMPGSVDHALEPENDGSPATPTAGFSRTAPRAVGIPGLGGQRLFRDQHDPRLPRPAADKDDAARMALEAASTSSFRPPYATPPLCLSGPARPGGSRAGDTSLRRVPRDEVTSGLFESPKSTRCRGGPVQHRGQRAYPGAFAKSRWSCSRTTAPSRRPGSSGGSRTSDQLGKQSQHLGDYTYPTPIDPSLTRTPTTSRARGPRGPGERERPCPRWTRSSKCAAWRSRCVAE